MHKQQKIAGSVLIALVALFLWTERERPVAAARPAEAPLRAAAAIVPATRIEMPARDAMATPVNDPFAADTPKSAAAAALARPANPYRFVGEMRSSGKTQRFLAYGDDIAGAEAGDVLKEGWKVEAVSEDQIVLVHSSGVRDVLAVGERALEDSARGGVMRVAEGSAPAKDAGLVQAVNLPAEYFVTIDAPLRRQD
jgi:hypothetical protein